MLGKLKSLNYLRRLKLKISTASATKSCNNACEGAWDDSSNAPSANSPTLINQLKICKLGQSNIVVCSNLKDTEIDLFTNFEELLTDKQNVPFESKDMISIDTV